MATDISALAAKYLPIIGKMSAKDLEQEIKVPDRLLISSEVVNSKTVEVCYAPFDHINPAAKLVIVGLTPGHEQAASALREAWRQLLAGRSYDEVLAAVQTCVRFSGLERHALVESLDFAGLHKRLGIRSSNELWTDASGLVHFTSALRYPVYVNRKLNYNGLPEPHLTASIKEQYETHLAQEVNLLRNSFFLPLGSHASAILNKVATAAMLPRDQVLPRMPHSGTQNGYRRFGSCPTTWSSSLLS